MTAPDLKPCPFCGADKVAVCQSERANPVFWVECISCNAETQPSTNKAEAIAAWNTRATDPRIEALERERDEAKAMQECACSYDTPTDVCVGHHRLFEHLYAVQRGKLEARLAECEARLSKAVEALRVLIDHTHNCEKELTEDLHRADFCGESLPLTNARTTLAEFEGGKDE